MGEDDTQPKDIFFIELNKTARPFQEYQVVASQDIPSYEQIIAMTTTGASVEVEGTLV
jgi:aspartyl/asparaginyl-tRNA synthetase